MIDYLLTMAITDMNTTEAEYIRGQEKRTLANCTDLLNNGLLKLYLYHFISLLLVSHRSSSYIVV